LKQSGPSPGVPGLAERQQHLALRAERVGALARENALSSEATKVSPTPRGSVGSRPLDCELPMFCPRATNLSWFNL